MHVIYVMKFQSHVYIGRAHITHIKTGLYGSLSEDLYGIYMMSLVLRFQHVIATFMLQSNGYNAGIWFK